MFRRVEGEGNRSPVMLGQLIGLVSFPPSLYISPSSSLSARYFLAQSSFIWFMLSPSDISYHGYPQTTSFLCQWLKFSAYQHVPPPQDVQ